MVSFAASSVRIERLMSLPGLDVVVTVTTAGAESVEPEEFEIRQA
jgi:hypothetical protein